MKPEAALRAFALKYPEAYEEFPWGERAIKVRGKVFVFMGRGRDGFGVSLKLPSSALVALNFPFARPTGYGLGKSGWVSATFASRQRIPVPLLREWIDESYRAVAPRALVRRLDGGTRATPRAHAGPRRAASRKHP